MEGDGTRPFRVITDDAVRRRWNSVHSVITDDVTGRRWDSVHRVNTDDLEGDGAVCTE